jgi:VWFA-related protein
MPSLKSDALRFILRFTVVALVVASGFLIAQESPKFSETIDVSLVNVEVIVTGPNGERVRGLTAADFTIVEEGKPQQIVNFAEYAGAGGNVKVGVEAAAAAHTAAEPPPRQPRTFIVFVDEVALVGAKADIRPTINDVLRQALQPGDTGAVLSWTNRLNVRQGFTGDVAALEKAIDALPKPGPLFTIDGMQQQWREDEAFWRSVAADPRNADLMLGGDLLTTSIVGQSMATVAWMDMKSKVRAINAAMTAMAGAEGRKVLLLVTHRFSRHIGQEYSLASRVKLDKPPAKTPRFDALRMIESVAETANATGFTIYGLHPEGLRATLESAEVSLAPDANSGPVGVRDHMILMNETESLELVSERTGGEYAFGSDALKLLPRVTEDLTDYYSLAYRTPSRGHDNRRKISVRVKNRNYRVRARSQYVERSDATRMKDRVSASVFAPIDPGTIPIVAEVDSNASSSRLPLTIRIPISALTTIANDGKHTGAFTVYVAWNSSGTVSDVTRDTQPFTINVADLERAKSSHFTYNLDVRIDANTRALGVGVLDETSKEFGVVTVPLAAAAGS